MKTVTKVLCRKSCTSGNSYLPLRCCIAYTNRKNTIFKKTLFVSLPCDKILFSNFETYKAYIYLTILYF